MNSFKKALFLTGALLITGMNSNISGWWRSGAPTIPDAVVEAGKAVNAAVRKGITFSLETPGIEKTVAALNELKIKTIEAAVAVDHKIPSLPRLEGTVQLSIDPVIVNHIPLTKSALKTITLSFASLTSFTLFLKLLHDLALDPTRRSIFAHCVMDTALVSAAGLLYVAYYTEEVSCIN